MSTFTDGNNSGAANRGASSPSPPPGPPTHHHPAHPSSAAHLLLTHLDATNPSVLRAFQARYEQTAADAARNRRTADAALEVGLEVDATKLLLSSSSSSSAAAATTILTRPEAVGAAVGPLLASAGPLLPVRAHVRLLKPPLPLVSPEQAQRAAVLAWSAGAAAAAVAAAGPTTTTATAGNDAFGGGEEEESDAQQHHQTPNRRLLVSVLGTVCAVSPSRRRPAVRRLACRRCGAAQAVDARLTPASQLAECCAASACGAAFDPDGWEEDVAGRYEEPEQVVWLTGAAAAAAGGGGGQGGDNDDNNDEYAPGPRPPLPVLLSGSDMCASLPLGAAVHVVGFVSVDGGASSSAALAVASSAAPALAVVLLRASSATVVKLAALRWGGPCAAALTRSVLLAGRAPGKVEGRASGRRPLASVGRALVALDAALGGGGGGARSSLPLDPYLGLALLLSAVAAGDDCMTLQQQRASARSQLHLLVLPRLAPLSGEQEEAEDAGLSASDADGPPRLLRQAAALLSPSWGSHARLTPGAVAQDGGGGGGGLLPAWTRGGSWAASRLWLSSAGVAVLSGLLPPRALRQLADAAMLRGAASASPVVAGELAPRQQLAASSDHALGLIRGGGGGKGRAASGVVGGLDAEAAREGVSAPMAATLWACTGGGGGDDGVAWPPPAAAAAAWGSAGGSRGSSSAAVAAAAAAASAAAATANPVTASAASSQLPSAAFDLVLRLGGGRRLRGGGAGGATMTGASGSLRDFRAALLMGPSQQEPSRRQQHQRPHPTYRHPDPTAATAVRALVGAAARRPPLPPSALTPEAAALLAAYASAAAAHGLAGAAGEGPPGRLLGLLVRVALASARVFGGAGGDEGGVATTANEERDATLAILLVNRSLTDRAAAAAAAAAWRAGSSTGIGRTAAAATAARAAAEAAASLLALPPAALGGGDDEEDEREGDRFDARLADLHARISRALGGGGDEGDGDGGWGGDGNDNGGNDGGNGPALRSAHAEPDEYGS
jgi:hypothetical protein